MKAGDARRLSAGQRTTGITIEAMTESVGGTRFPQERWSPIALVYAAVDRASGGEAFTVHQVSATESVRFTIAYRADCDPDVVDVAKYRRVVSGGRVHDITGAELIGRRRGVTLHTRAKVG